MPAPWCFTMSATWLPTSAGNHLVWAIPASRSPTQTGRTGHDAVVRHVAALHAAGGTRLIPHPLAEADIAKLHDQPVADAARAARQAPAARRPRPRPASRSRRSSRTAPAPARPRSSPPRPAPAPSWRGRTPPGAQRSPAACRWRCTALSPRPTPMSKRPSDCTAIAPNRLAATDHSRVIGLVTQGPKRKRCVWSMATAICG